MKKVQIFCLVFGVMIFMICSSNSLAEEITEITAVGILQKQEITTYQYGTHILVDNNKTLYALKSSTVVLDKYIAKKVKIHGSIIQGYPVDSGPDYFDVRRVDLFKEHSSSQSQKKQYNLPPDPKPYCVDCGAGYHCVHNPEGCAPDPKPTPPLNN